MTLTEFLLARIAEDEELARHGLDVGAVTVFWRIPRVLAECEAKRQIVEQAHYDRGGKWIDLDDCPILHALALPYADHPDYDEAWRP